MCNTHWGVTFCYWNFCFHIVKPLIPILTYLPISLVCKELEHLDKQIVHFLYDCSESFLVVPERILLNSVESSKITGGVFSAIIIESAIIFTTSEKDFVNWIH